uniref:Uncharacterized protein n=1 Tax=Panagrolaimus sp. JU765 TaxID=591449 RepID=A0AC34RHC6_9BILA
MVGEIDDQKDVKRDSQDNQRWKTFIFKEKSIESDENEDDNDFDKNDGLVLDKQHKHKTFDLSETTSTMIISFGQFNTRKRYVCDKEVDTRIAVDNATTITDSCLKEDKSTQYEQQKLSSEATRRAVNMLAETNFLINAISIIENEISKRQILD